MPGADCPLVPQRYPKRCSLNRRELSRDTLKVAEMQAQAAGFSPLCEVIPGDPEKVIADYVDSHDIHLLLMGAYGHSRIRHLVIGSTTIQLLRSSQMPVLLFR